MTAIGPPQRFSFESADSEATAEFITAAYGMKTRMSGLAPGHPFRLSRRDAGQFALDTATAPLRLEYASEPWTATMVMQVKAGTAERAIGRLTERAGAGETFIVCQPGLAHHLWTQDAVMDLATFEPELVARVAATAPARRPCPVRFTGYRPVSAEAGERWRAVHRYVTDLIVDPEAGTQPLILGSAARLLAATMLATFPNTALTDPTIEDRRDASAAALRRAITFMDEHAGDDISAADIAAAANVTMRAIQLAFRRHLDTTPMAYLRRVRLEHARRELLAADPARDTVKAVAARWGFARPDRFTASYRDLFGVLPYQTLRDS
jgi:AraC-like DNA-binding protein